MTIDNRSHLAARTIGITLMSVASLVAPIGDVIAKRLTENHSPYLIAWARYATATLIVLPLSLIWWRSTWGFRRHLAANALRSTLSVASMTCFFFAITQIPLASAFGGYFLGPVIAALMAAPVLGEKLTAMRLGASVLGVFGAYFIVKPGIDLQLGSLLAVLSGILFSGYLITARMMPTTASDALRFQCAFGALALAPFAIWQWSSPARDEILLILIMGGTSAICHLMVLVAFRLAEASVLAPLVYLELVTATMCGHLIFSETPDRSAWTGIASIVLGGLLIWADTRARL